jgi:hypothetical protein
VGRLDRHKKRTQKKGFGILKIGFTLLGVICICLFIFYQFATSKDEEPVIYFSDTFATENSRWISNDAFWETAEPSDGKVNLNRNEFLTPNLYTQLESNEIPLENFVWHFKVKVTSFTDRATTLGAIYFPTGSLTVVVNEEGKLGVAQNLFQDPEYSESTFSAIKKGEWEDVYVHVDDKNEQLSLYLNDKKIFQKKWVQDTNPIQEIWLGTVWLKGAGQYGSAVNISFDEISIADENILPKPSFLQYYLNLFIN